ncbi:hypothetical protein K0M31_001158, partial [Melipona bicolor]
SNGNKTQNKFKYQRTLFGRVSTLQYLRSGYRHVPRKFIALRVPLAGRVAQNTGHMAGLLLGRRDTRPWIEAWRQLSRTREKYGPARSPTTVAESGPSCPTLDPGPRFPAAEGRGTEKTFGPSFGFLIRITSTSDR